MAIIDEVAATIKLVSESISNLKNIYTEVNDGYEYFTTIHPEIKKDVIARCTEVQKTCNAVAEASSIITRFRFNTSSGAIDYEPRHFNDYFINHLKSTLAAEELIRSLKGSCGKIARELGVPLRKLLDFE